MTQRSISGAILPQDLRAGTWLLRADPPGGAAVYLRSVGPDGSELLSDRRITRIDIEWRAQDVSCR